MTGPCILLGAALIMATMLEIDFRHERRRRARCLVTRQDARWLTDALGHTDCPACDRPLASHRR